MRMQPTERNSREKRQETKASASLSIRSDRPAYDPIDPRARHQDMAASTSSSSHQGSDTASSGPQPPTSMASLMWKCFWICALSFQYGYNISALNGLSSALTCDGTQPSSLLPKCFEMTRSTFGLVTSIYTIGGLLGSLVTGTIADRYGRKTACLGGSASIATGGLIMALSPRFPVLVVGRLIVGLGCGIATVIVPTYLSEIAPSQHKGRIGVLNQVGIVSGIFLGQCASIGLAAPGIWRYVPLITGLVAVVQIFLAPTMMESPVWLAHQADGDASEGVGGVNAQGSRQEDDGVHERLLEGASVHSSDSERSSSVSKPPPRTIWGVIKSPLTRKGLRIVFITQIAQQACGINAVLYYSTDIMKTALPGSAQYLALVITAVNFVMTFPPLFLIDRVGRRPLLLLSVGCMGLSSLLLSLSITSSPVVASLAILAFVAAFSIGLGPIPFLIIPEVVPPQSAAATASFGLTLNWLTNFVVGAVFWPLSQQVGEKNIFVGFAVVAAVATLLIGSVYQ